MYYFECPVCKKRFEKVDIIVRASQEIWIDQESGEIEYDSPEYILDTLRVEFPCGHTVEGNERDFVIKVDNKD